MSAATMTTSRGNDGFIECWNEILTPKWLRFRHLLSGNGKIHGDIAWPRFGIKPGHKVLDIGCGFGETCLDTARLVGPTGEVVGLDCVGAFLDVANRERDEAGVANVRYELGDAQEHPLPREHFDVACARFGVMFFESAVRALRNAHTALKPGGTLGLCVWRSLADNPAWGAAKEAVLEFLPPPAGGKTCGPGPFSWEDPDTDRRMLAAAGFTTVEVFEPIDADMCIGSTIEEAVDFQLLVGPSGEIVREAGAEGQRRLPEIRARLERLMRDHLRESGNQSGNESARGVYMSSGSWVIVARK